MQQYKIETQFKNWIQNLQCLGLGFQLLISLKWVRVRITLGRKIKVVISYSLRTFATFWLKKKFNLSLFHWRCFHSVKRPKYLNIVWWLLLFYKRFHCIYLYTSVRMKHLYLILKRVKWKFGSFKNDKNNNSDRKDAIASLPSFVLFSFLWFEMPRES